MKQAENILINIEGMDCANCALGITKKLESKGAGNVNVNFATGEATFTLVEPKKLSDLIKDIHKLGYKVIDKPGQQGTTLSLIEKRFYFCLIFTIPLFSHMFLPFDFLQNPFVQLVLCLPVFIVGLIHFGKSAWNSLRSGVPNMDVLIAIGSIAAFFYSLAGTIMHYGSHEVHNYLFYETSATIITLVLLGNVLEHRSVKQTTTAVKDLTSLQVTFAKRISIYGNEEKIEEINFSDVKKNDILLINSGDKIPVDGKIISGEATIDEAMISGESMPVEKRAGDNIIGGTILLNGNIKMRAEKVGKETVLSQIIEMVKKAQNTKPSIQKLGDKVSAVFVPVVIFIAILTFILSYAFFDISAQKALMNSIAVLVISCPCAMGLATPTAVMVGIGRAAKNGILIKGGSTLEDFAKVKTIVFDKTGTLTTGKFKIKKIHPINITEQEAIDIIYNLEQFSSHSLAKSLIKELKGKAANKTFIDVKETKGLSIEGKDEKKNNYKIGSYNIASHLTSKNEYSLFVLKNGNIVAGIDIEDEIKSGAKKVVTNLKISDIEPVLLSGDNKEKCEKLVGDLGIKKFYHSQLPEQKLQKIEELSKNSSTAMVGDGINDAPALAKATVGISLSNATQVAVQAAQVILLNHDISKVYDAYLISKHTFITIKQNLFWAFFYNIVAIPIAAFGLLNPMIAALAMAFSDVIVIGNSIRLRTKKLN